MTADCPQCGAPLGCHDGIDDPSAKPTGGDVSLCAHCGQIAIWDTDGTLRPPTRAELDEIWADVRVVTAVAALKASNGIHEAVDVARRVHARRN